MKGYVNTTREIVKKVMIASRHFITLKVLHMRLSRFYIEVGSCWHRTDTRFQRLFLIELSF
jgi:hypothetical protein